MMCVDPVMSFEFCQPMICMDPVITFEFFHVYLHFEFSSTFYICVCIILS